MSDSSGTISRSAALAHLGGRALCLSLAAALLAACGAGDAQQAPAPTPSAPAGTPQAGPATPPATTPADTTATQVVTFTVSGTRSTGVAGVSSGVARIGATTYVFPTSTTDRGVGVYRAAANGMLTRVGSAGLDRSSDATVVRAGARWRMYYATASGAPQPGATGPVDKLMRSATSSDGVTWSDEGVRLADVGWGVPDVTRQPGGVLRVWWVDGSGADEVLRSATSRDGLTFTADAAHRVSGGWVDPAVILAADGDYVMLVSDTPARGEQRPQHIYVGTSTDGVTWTIDPSPVATGLDPAGIATGANTWRIWWSAMPRGGPPASGGGGATPPEPVVHTATLTRAGG